MLFICVTDVFGKQIISNLSDEQLILVYNILDKLYPEKQINSCPINHVP